MLAKIDYFLTMKQKIRYYLFITSILTLTAGCSSDIPTVNIGLDDVYYIPRMQKLQLTPALTGSEYRWSVRRLVEKADSNYENVSTDRELVFLESEEGEYVVKFEIIDSETPLEHEFTVNVMHEEVEYSPNISRVYEYCPAPGQFINEMPRYEEGDTYASILQKVEESISGENDTMISLGGFGGYVTFGFDHTVINKPGEADFRIWGNAFYELLNPEKKGGSAEPGIVMVSYDVNCNGVPDDPWYELRGSEYDNPATQHGYEIMYRRPDPNHEVIADDDNSLEDIHYIAWEDNRGVKGYIPKNYFHSNDYYPKWIDEDTISFRGSLLPNNSEDISGMGTYFVLYSYDYGYVDNHPNEYEELNSFKIENAVDSDGHPVELPGVDFIRVYTGLNQYCGWLGETSTELCRAADLNLKSE